MGVQTTVVQTVTCDCCHKPIEKAFKPTPRKLWQDRDVSATLTVSVNLVIDYSTQPNVLCTACVVDHLRTEANRLEAELVQQGNIG